mmetsp:Transcript_23816/g.36497  ORF Transcript_23816/g.36497 Transcript_23816/m.36497 type:complete len:197 (-) Transcript_23816:7-597(-)
MSKTKSMVSELQLYTSDLHKEIQLFMEKKKVEIQAKFLELQNCLKEVRCLKEGVALSKIHESHLALIVACLVEMAKLEQAAARSFDAEEPSTPGMDHKLSAQTLKLGNSQANEFGALRKDLQFMKLRLASRSGNSAAFGSKRNGTRNGRMLLKQPGFASNEDLLQVRSRQDLFSSGIKQLKTFDRIAPSSIGSNPY